MFCVNYSFINCTTSRTCTVGIMAKIHFLTAMLACAMYGVVSVPDMEFLVRTFLRYIRNCGCIIIYKMIKWYLCRWCVVWGTQVLLNVCSFWWGLSYPCFGLLVTSHLDFKARVGSTCNSALLEEIRKFWLDFTMVVNEKIYFQV